MKKILVCEDEAAIRDFVVINLVRGGYDVIEADCGETALKKYDENGGNIDVAILDVMMPGMDGFQVCKELRQRNGSIGIIMLTAKTQEMDKVTGLLLGADDYVTKPFSPSELVARVDALHRRVVLAQKSKESNFKEELKSGEFVLNLRNRALLKNGKMIDLTQVEFQIMEYFFSNHLRCLASSTLTMSLVPMSAHLFFHSFTRAIAWWIIIQSTRRRVRCLLSQTATPVFTPVSIPI